MRLFSLIFVSLLFISCSNQTPQDVEQHVDQLIAEDQYEQAIETLEDADPEETDADLPTLKEKAHLNYGLYLEYRGPEDSSMRDRMTAALEQYIEVLHLNPENQQARDEINQIMSIYGTMPDRSPGDDILDELNEFGFDF